MVMFSGKTFVELSKELTQKGDEAFAANNYTEAEKYYRMAISYWDPATCDTKIKLAHVLFYHLNKQEEALEYFKQYHLYVLYLENSKSVGLDFILKNKFIYPEILKEYSKQLVKAGEFDQALKHIELAIKQVSRDNYFDVLLNCLNKHADHLIDKFLSDPKVTKSNNDKDVIFNIITDDASYIGVSKHVKRLVIRRALVKGNVLGDIMWKKRGAKEPSLESGTLAKLHEELKKFSRYSIFDSELDRLIKIDPTNAYLYIRRGEYRFKQPPLSEANIFKKIKFESAFEDYRRYTMLSPTDSAGYYNAAACLVVINRDTEALNYISQAIQLDSHNQSYYEFQIDLLNKLGRTHHVALVKFVVDVGFSEELKKEKNKKQIIFQKIQALPSADQRLELFKLILEKKSILGEIMWEPEGTIVKTKPNLSSGILKDIQDEVTKLESPQVATQEQSKSALPPRFSIFDVDLTIEPETTEELVATNDNNNEKEYEPSFGGKFMSLFGRFAISANKQPKNITAENNQGLPAPRLNHSSSNENL